MQTTRQATEAQWATFVKEARARGATITADCLEERSIHYCEGTDRWIPPGGIQPMTSKVSAPVETRSFGTRVATTPGSAKAFHELTNREKHDLYLTDRKAYDALRDTPETHHGKTWDEMDADEAVALYREDREKWIRMREKAMGLDAPRHVAGGGVTIVTDDEDAA